MTNRADLDWWEGNERAITDAQWRVGRKLQRTLYAVVGEEPSDDDVLLGMVDDPAIAALIVSEHNQSRGYR